LTTQIQALTPAQFDLATSMQLASLSFAQVAALQSAQVVAIGSADIKGLLAIDGLSTQAMPALAPEQVANLASTQVRALTTTQFKSLNSAQANALTPEQLLGLSTNQVIALDQVAGLSLSSRQLSALSETLHDIHTGSSAELKRLTPLALDLNGDGIHSISSASGVVFDVNADGQSEQVGWLSAGDAWLALDRNGNGLIDDGSELFGCGTRMPDGSKAVDGFAALRMLDNNQDGAIDAGDSSFDKLLIWVDSNLNAKTDPGEIRTLSQADIKVLSLSSHATSILDQGNLIGLVGSYTTSDGRSWDLVDIWLRVDPSSPQSESPAPPSANVAGNPVGRIRDLALTDVLSFGDANIVPGSECQSKSEPPDGGMTARSLTTTGSVESVGLMVADTGAMGDPSSYVLKRGLTQLLVEDKLKIIAV